MNHHEAVCTVVRKHLSFRAFPGKQVFFYAFVLTLILGALVTVIPAQTAGTGAIAGTITDNSGALVSGAEIKGIDGTTGEARTTVSTSSGTYVVPLLRPGTYRVEVTKSGF